MEIKAKLKSKTFWLGILTILTGIVEFAFSQPAGTSIATIVIGILVIVIRFYTNTALVGTPGAKAK